MRRKRAEFIYSLIVLIAFVSFDEAFSAIDRQSGWISPKQALNKSPTLNTSKLVTAKQTLLALELPFENRIQVIRDQGPQGYLNLREIMFGRDSKIDSRWRATMALGRIGGKHSLPELERASKASVWELRSAALIAVSRIDRREASKWARRLLNDKALLVRLTAVETLESIVDRASTPELWAQLENRQNFKGNRGLFIRRRIVEALTQLEAPSATNKFARLLEEEDPQIHRTAILALEKMTGQKMGKSTDPVSRRRALWLQWSSTQNSNQG
jgi:HEAT repeat protein